MENLKDQIMEILENKIQELENKKISCYQYIAGDKQKLDNPEFYQQLTKDINKITELQKIVDEI